MANLTVLFNTIKTAPSQFTNHIATAFALFNDDLIFSTEDGLYVYAGDNDGYTEVDGEQVAIPIEATFALPQHDFGYNGEKSARSLLLEGKIDGQLKVTLTSKVLDDSEDVEESREYFTEELENATGTKIALDTDQRSRYLQFEFSNVDGAYFAIDSADFVFIPGPELRK